MKIPNIAWLFKKMKRCVGIVEDGDTASQNIASGKLVVWKGLPKKANQAISSGDALSSTNLDDVSEGFANLLNSNITALQTVTSNTSVSGIQTLKKCGKLVIASWSGKTIPSANGWQTLFTLPEGYRPSSNTEFCAASDYGSDAFRAIEGRIYSSGEIKVYVYALYQGKACYGQVVFFT